MMLLGLAWLSLFILMVVWASREASMPGNRPLLVATMRDQIFLKRIAEVDPIHAETMETNPTTFLREPLPFYKTFVLVRAQVSLPHHPLLFFFADDGRETTLPLGDPEDIALVNEAERLRLSVTDVEAYLRFYLAVVDRKFVPAERSADVDWLPTADTVPAEKAAKAAAALRLHPVHVTPRASGGFEATATGRRDQTLVEATFTVGAEGRVTKGEEKTLQSNLPVHFRI